MIQSESAPRPTPSLLSVQIRAEHKQSSSAPAVESVSSANLKSIIVYSPKKEPIKVAIEEADIVSAVIKKTLDAHQKQGKSPFLLYNAPECYDLRLHEGKKTPEFYMCLTVFVMMYVYRRRRTRRRLPRSGQKAPIAPIREYERVLFVSQ